MGKKSGPKPPDMMKQAMAQAEIEKSNLTQQTWANRVNQYTPYGSQTYESQADIDPATGKPVTRWTQKTTLDPRMQGTLDAQLAQQQQRAELAQSMSGRLAQEYGQPMDWSGLSDWGTGPTATSTSAVTNPFGFGPDVRGRAEDAIYRSATSRLDPQWEQRERQIDTQLKNQGITPGSTAYTRAMGEMNRSRTDAYNQAMLGSITGGGAEAQREQGMMLGQQQQGFTQGLQANQQNFQQQQAAAQMQNMLRQQQLEEAIQRRGFTLNELNSLNAGQQVGMPQFSNYSQSGMAGAPNLMGAAQSQYETDAARQQQRNAGTAQTIGTIASIAAMFV